MGVGTGVATGARAPPVFELPVSSESEIHLKVGVVSPKILPCARHAIIEPPPLLNGPP